MSAYSELKAAWHTDRIDALRRGEQIVPTQVQLILSDLCNQDCHFCAYRSSAGFSSQNFADETGNHNPNRMIPYEKAVGILEDCSVLGVRAIQFTGGGEPTVHPKHLEVFQHAQHLGLETSLVTNGVIFRKDWERVLPRMSWVRVSLDAGTPDNYAKVRRTSLTSFGMALANITRLAAEIRKQESKCLLGVGFVITRENYQEIVRAVGLAKDSGAQNVRLSAMFSKDYDKYYDGIRKEIREKISMAKALECNYFKVYDLFGDRMADMEQHRPDYTFCGYQQFNMYIGGDLKVYRCCNTSYTDHGEVGDLRNQSLHEWFQSEQKHTAYATFDAHTCDVCQFNNKNKVMNYLTVGEPTHVNFV